MSETQQKPIAMRMPADMAEFIPEYLKNRRQDLTTLQQAVTDSNLESARITGHNMRGTGKTYGFDQISEWGEAIETAAEQGRIETIKHLISELENYLTRLRITYEDADTSQDRPPPCEKKFTAVVTDDSGASRKLLVAILKNSPIEVLGEAACGSEGMELCKSKEPDLLFLDIVMPEMSGVEVLEKIRGICPATRVIMVTSIAERDVVMKTKDLGAYDYLLKPLKKDQLETEIGRICDRLSEAVK